ncbi:MAG: hypothetical protein KQJ78_03545 [Deltaproteobacteria bacterium]|nr:hypothetical protein [Deltaproteobacteria bacterium]
MKSLTHTTPTCGLLWRTIFLGLALILLVGLALGPGCAKKDETPRFTADMVFSVGEGSSTGKVYMDGPRLRLDVGSPEPIAVTILDRQADKLYTIVPSEHQYAVQKLSDLPSGVTVGIPLPPPNAKPEGHEEMAGYQVDKYTFEDPKRGQVTLWYSPKLTYTLKAISQGKMGKLTTELQNIKEGPVQGDLFTPPADFRRVGDKS